MRFHHAFVPSTALVAEPDQKLSRSVKSISRGPGSPNKGLVWPLMIPTCVGALMLEAGTEKFGWLKMFTKMGPPEVASSAPSWLTVPERSCDSVAITGLVPYGLRRSPRS
jgi:hypothetical protein